ncbi:MAG: hypothetical protein IT158_26010 [Bryobacterales bacterium]|nr:hypothetical protein [Bryobacterales bacterium]
MSIRRVIACLILGGLACAQTQQPASLRGALVQSASKPPAIRIAEGRLVSLSADDPVAAVLNDKRLAGLDVEVTGRFTAPDRFQVDPIHTRPVFVHKNGKRLYVTYWCDLCAIRTYTPGKCQCCQEETEIDLRETEK